MRRKTIAICLTFIFMGLITAPSIIAAIDDSVDISIFYSISEEENETVKLTLPAELDQTHLDSYLSAKMDIDYRFSISPLPHLGLTLPPPEQIVS